MSNGVKVDTLHIFEIPELVLRQCLSYLSFLDLCRLRLTSTFFQEYATEFMNKMVHFRVEINQNTSNPFQAAMSTTTLKIDELIIKNDSEEFYLDPFVQDFLAYHGGEIKCLKMKQFFVNSQVQLDFLNELPNVTSLEIAQIDAEDVEGFFTRMVSRAMDDVLEVPGFLSQLKSLSFGVIRIRSLNSTGFWYAMMNSCPQLNYVRYPRIICESRELGFHSIKYDCWEHLITKQRQDFIGEPDKWLTTIDLENLDDEEDFESEAENLMFFEEEIRGLGIRLINIRAELLDTIIGRIPVDRNVEVKFVKSLIGFHPGVEVLPLNHLESISFPSMAQTIRIWRVPVRTTWRALKSVSINFDRGMDFSRYKNAIATFMDFIIFPPGRKNVEELRISFDSEIYSTLDEIPSTVLNARKLTTGLNCLTKLSLVRWNPVNKAFIILWKGLPILEELFIEDCATLGNVGFIGTNLSSPAFLQLKRLVKLTLVLDQMPKVTERSFQDVFRHMRLREFTLRSVGTLENVTKAGISWLLQGEFAQTVEKFPFHTWESVHISVAEMKQLKAEFKTLIS